MNAWLTTSEAADMLGTSLTTIRTMADRGDLVALLGERPSRRRWLISRESVDNWLETYGRLDCRRQYQRARRVNQEATWEQYTALLQQLVQVEDERRRLVNEVANLRAAALEQRASSAALGEAYDHQARATRYALETAEAQADAAAALRRALVRQEDASGQFLIPDGPGYDR